MSVYVWELKGANPVIFKPHIDRAAPDCGGEECDEIYYMPHCPNCDRRFDYFEHFKFCPNCGTKLWWKYQWPLIEHPDEDESDEE